MSPRITVLIAAAGQPVLLARTLASLAACERPAGYAGIVVVENGPRCGIQTVVRALPAEALPRYVYVPLANKSHALNVALDQIDEGLVVFTDDDTRADRGLLAAYARGAAGTSSGEFYGGPLVAEYEHDPPPDWMRPMLPSHMLGWQLRTASNKAPHRKAFLGPNWAAFRCDLLAMGGFEPRLGPGGVTGGSGQETDAQHRLRAAGVGGYYLPDAKVWHLCRDEYLTSEWLVRRAYRQGLGWGIRHGRSRYSAGHWVWTGLRAAAVWTSSRLMHLASGERWRLTADFAKRRWQGRLDGIALGRRWDEIPCPPRPGDSTYKPDAQAKRAA